MTVNRPTLRDLASAAQVSVCTASKAMRDGRGVAQQTIERVRTAAETIGYVPNDAARALVSQQARTLGFLVSNTTNRYYGTLLSAANSVAQKAGFNIISGDSVDASGVPDPLLEKMFMQSLAQHRVAGAMVVGPVAVESVRTFLRWNTPIVFVDSLPPDAFPFMPAVLTDNFAGGQLAGEHFVAHGYHRFLFVGHPPVWSSRAGREEGFVASTAGHGTVDVVEGGYNADEARDAVRRYLAEGGRPDCVFGTNDAMLRGAMGALSDHGLHVGTDVGAISFDEFDWAAYLSPGLTTIDQHISELGMRAAEVLLELCADPERKPSRRKPNVHQLTPTLITRQSCGCP